MAGQLYSRWVPPSAKSALKSAPPTPIVLRNPIALPAAESPGAKLQKKEKKNKKSKRDALENSSTAKEGRDQVLDVFRQESSAQSTRPEQKAVKRKREPVAQTELDTDETIPKKHKSILSKFERSMKISANQERAAAETSKEVSGEDNGPVEELHDLIPLPQPAPVPDAPFEPTFSTLPAWLSHPIAVDSSTTVPFAELGVQEIFVKKLARQGFTDALAVQTVLLPMLQSGFEQHLGDICVSARTGSGKTLAYLLPIVEALKDRTVTTLSAIVVVPSRQLVDQALKVAEELCAGTKLKVGTALGNVPFTAEQKQLVKVRAQYDPAQAKKAQEQASHQLSLGIVDHGAILEQLADMPANHVPQYESGVDILICTPGRLVEHIESTTGFLLRNVNWLIIDEADQLLSQNFQGWANVLMDALHDDTPEELMSIREKLRKKRRESIMSLALPKHKQLTKVILSATMKKDLTKLGTLRLRRPKLVVVEDEGSKERPIATDNDVFELPTTLDEFALPVDDGSKKPLYLLYLLLQNILFEEAPGPISSSSASESSSSSDSSGSESSDSEEEAVPKRHSRVLIFAKSNENASRLSHLLTTLEPSIKSFIKTMAPSFTAKESQKILRSFAQGTTKILIASDAASRGLDIPDITHVVNYDMPSSITSYVHRVGRTARAGKNGQSWTLVAKNEAAWFWKVIARGGNVQRAGKKVLRVELNERDVTWDRKRTYQVALRELQGAVEGNDDNVQ